jgi:lysyl-tRNA synthetase class 2
MLASCRAFFQKRGVTEVDCCALSPFAPIDSNIDIIPAQVTPSLTGYLHSSPEYAMKRLIASGCKDIYYLGHVFRQGEIGRLHSPEFTMAEWYRLGFTFDEMIQETAEFIFQFLGTLPIKKISYREAFQTYLGIDYTNATLEELCSIAKPLAPHCDSWGRTPLIHFLLTAFIEPNFGNEELTIFLDYPPQEAALAKTIEKNGELVAERFEAYYQGVELCNGYHELPDSKELRHRFEAENKLRNQMGKTTYALDEAFLQALGPHFPPCCGVAVGFDRLLLLKLKLQSLSEVLPFAYPHA